MEEIKELLKEIKEEEKTKGYTTLAYDKNWKINSLYDRSALIPENYYICELILNNGYNKPYQVNTKEELQKLVKLFKSFKDVLKVSHVVNRVDVYYKNGRKAISVVVKN